VLNCSRPNSDQYRLGLVLDASKVDAPQVNVGSRTELGKARGEAAKRISNALSSQKAIIRATLLLNPRQRFSKLYEEKGLILHSWNSRGRHNISPASRHRTAHSSRLRYWSNLTTFPSHTSPAELVITTTFGTSHGPTQPLTVNWTRFNSPRFRHSLFNHSTGTAGNPRSILPQQQPRQIVTWPTTRRLVLSG